MVTYIGRRILVLPGQNLLQQAQGGGKMLLLHQMVQNWLLHHLMDTYLHHRILVLLGQNKQILVLDHGMVSVHPQMVQKLLL